MGLSVFDICRDNPNDCLFFFTTCNICVFSVLMRKFLYKFLIFYAIVFGYIYWYSIWIYPNISGELGVLGQIPFGNEYDQKLDSIFHHSNCYFYNVSEGDTLSSNIFTIGDSFSNRKVGHAYQQFLGEILEQNINNIRPTCSPEQFFVKLLNNNYFPIGSIVIVESVERSMIERLCLLDFSDSDLPRLNNSIRNKKNNDKMSLLEGAAAKIRVLIGYKNPVRRYDTSIDLFSHPTIHNKIFLFDAPWENYEFGVDGDFVFRYLSEESFGLAYDNLLELRKFSEAKGVHFIYLIAADKYEVYEPFIIDEHPYNSSLDKCPREDWVINTKPVLSEAAGLGVKDIYRINDTHWSPTGAKLVAEELAIRLNHI